MVDSVLPHNIPDRRPFYARTRLLFFFLLAVVVYSYGWRVTNIELGELVRDAHLVKPLVRDLLRPDLLTFDSTNVRRSRQRARRCTAQYSRTEATAGLREHGACSLYGPPPPPRSCCATTATLQTYLLSPRASEDLNDARSTARVP